MSRLTKTYKDGTHWDSNDLPCGENSYTYKNLLIDKLGKYEDLEELIGIPVEELAKIFRQHIPDGCQHPKKAIVLTDGDVDKWRKYKDLEEHGRLVKLPCKVGDTIYGIHKAMVCELDTETIGISKMPSGEILYLIDGWELDKGDFGKTVFLTKAEVEAKLKELRGDKG